MAEADPRTVFVGENARIAEAVVQLLAAAGIAAEVSSSSLQTTSDPLTGATDMAPAEAFPVLVTDATKLEDARELLAKAETAAAVHALRERRANRSGTVVVKCEECGQESNWPATAMGTTDYCPHCQAYMDIPDPDDDWSDMDFGEPEGEDEGKGE